MYNKYQGRFSSTRQKYFDKVVETLSKSSKVLDIGCGQGDFLMSCKKQNIVAFGIDPLKKWVIHCNKIGLKTKIGFAEKLPFKDHSFDVVFSQSVLEHVKDPLVMINEVRRVLIPGGTAIISVPTPEDSFWDDPTHIRPYTPKSLYTLFEMCNFENVVGNYVFSFLLGIKCDNSIFYKLLNKLPLALGSNLIFYAQKPQR